MELNDKLPELLWQQLQPELAGDEKIRFSLKSDLSLERKFGESWLVVTDRSLTVLDSQAVVLKLPFDQIKEVKVDELSGSSRMVAVTEDGWISLVYYTKVRVPEFGVLCRVINQIKRGVPIELPEEEEYAYCPKCGLPLPERGTKCPFCVPRWKVFQRLIGYLKPFKNKMIVLILGSVIGVGTQMIPPYITKRIVDDVIKGDQYETLNFWILLMLASALVFLGTRLLNGLLSAWLAARLVATLRNNLHKAIQRLQLNYFHKRGTGDLIGRVMHDTNELHHFLIDGFPYMMINTISVVVIAVILMRMDLRLSLLVFLPVPFLVFGANWFWRRLDPLFHKWGARVSSLHTILSESINGIRVVKAFAQETRRSGKFDGHSDQLFKISYNINSTFIGFDAVMFWVMRLGVTGVWFFAARRLVQNDPTLTLGDLLAFVGYIWLLYGPLQWFTAVLNWMTHAFAGAERIFAVLDTPPEVYDAPDAVSLPAIKGAIRFTDVHFSYEKGKEVIKGISFDVRPGEMIGLVGKSGAGKSTLINLICRFYDADSGAITIDGHSIRKIKLEQFRQQLGMVLQETFLFNGSIIDNIRYGNPRAPFEEVVRAARAAHAHDFILDKEDGYDTVVGEHGEQLSGGEKQRISIARAILHDPPILILDEATSSVDSETEGYIQEAIATLIKGRTTIAIAHRLSTLRNASRLFFVEDGRIPEMGSHDELMAKNGHFARLVEKQSQLNKIKGAVWKG